MATTVQDILDIVDRFLGDEDEVYYETYTGDGGTAYFKGRSPLKYQSETITVNSVTKTRSTHYNVNYSTGDITFTVGNIPANDASVVISAVGKKFPYATKLMGIKAALSEYWYVTFDSSLTLPALTQSISLTGKNFYQVLTVDLNDSDDSTEDHFVEYKGWYMDANSNPTIIYFKDQYTLAYPLRIWAKKTYSTNLTIPCTFCTCFSCGNPMGFV